MSGGPFPTTSGCQCMSAHSGVNMFTSTPVGGSRRTWPSANSMFMAPRWRPDSRGRRVVEPKDATKKRIKRSPDDADAVNLAYAPPPPKEGYEFGFS